MYRFIFTLFVINILFIHAASAVTIVQCEDEEGNRSFQAYCPPEMTLVEEKKLQTKTHPTPTIVPTVYLAPKCPACEAVRKFFKEKEINTVEKNIDANIELQNELKGLVGNLKIPTVVIGDKVMTDYKRAELISALMAIGYTELDLKE